MLGVLRARGVGRRWVPRHLLPVKDVAVLMTVPWLAATVAVQRPLAWSEATGAWSPAAVVVAVLLLHGSSRPTRPRALALLASMVALALVVMAGASAPVLGDRSALAALLGLVVGAPLLAAPAPLAVRDAASCVC